MDYSKHTTTALETEREFLIEAIEWSKRSTAAQEENLRQVEAELRTRGSKP